MSADRAQTPGLPAWLANHRPTPAVGHMPTPAWSVAHWTEDGIVLDGGAHDRVIAQQFRDEQVAAGVIPATAFVVASRDVR